MDWKIVLWVSLLQWSYVTCVLISSPFDNFRIECPQKSGVQRLTIKMAESEGRLRQDTVFALSCNPINEIYPWEHIPQGIQDLEREDCHYTGMFDPIMDTNVSFTCTPREYIAGISRVTDTRIQIMCCRMRTRDSTNCADLRFGKPIGTESKAEIQLNGKLINAISIEQNLYKVRFCDLVPRAIVGKLETTSSINTISTTKIPSTTPKNKIHENQELENLDVSNPKAPEIQSSTSKSTVSAISSNVPSTTPESVVLINDKDPEDEKVKFKTLQPKKIENNVELAVKVSGVKQQTDIEKVAEQLAKEIEKESDPIRADELFKASVEMLSEISTTEETVSSAKIGNNMFKEEKSAERPVVDSFERRKAEDSEERDVFEPELLPSAKITLPTESLSKKPKHTMNRLSFTSDVNDDPFGEVEPTGGLTTDHAPDVLTTSPATKLRTQTPQVLTSSSRMVDKITIITTESPLPTTSTINEAPQTSTFNTPVEPNTPILRIIKKNRKKIIRKPILKPAVEEIPEDILLAASNSEETRRSPVGKLSDVTLPPLDNFPSPPSTYRSRKPGDLPRYSPRRPVYVDSVSDFEEYDDLFRPTARPSYVPGKPLPTTRHPPRRRPIENQPKSLERPYVDEETRASPFESQDVPTINSRPRKEPINEILETEEEFVATANPRFRKPSTRYESESPFEIRRSPTPREPEVFLDINDDIPKDDLDEVQTMPTIPDEVVLKEFIATRTRKANPNITKDGVKNFKPPNNIPMNITEEILKEMQVEQSDENTLQAILKNIETLVPMNAVRDISTTPPSTTTNKVETTTSELLTSIDQTSVEDETTPTTPFRRPTTTPYDPAAFYHTVPVPKTTVKERYLTFCTKDVAIRDSSNMIVACGDGVDVWYPPRCPPGTACFYTHDSTFRICCPVFDG